LFVAGAGVGFVIGVLMKSLSKKKSDLTMNEAINVLKDSGCEVTLKTKPKV